MRRLVLDAWANVCAQREWSPPTPGTAARARVADADEDHGVVGNSPAPRRAAAAGAISPPLALGKRERGGGEGKADGERDAKRG